MKTGYIAFSFQFSLSGSDPQMVGCEEPLRICIKCILAGR